MLTENEMASINDSFILQTAMNSNLLPPCQVYIETQTLT